MSFAPRADPLSKACNFKISVGPGRPTTARRRRRPSRRSSQGFTSASGRAGAGGAQRRHPPPGRVPASHRRPASTVPRPDAPASEACNGGSPSPGGSRWRGLAKGTRSIRSFQSRSFTIRDSDRNASRLEFSEFEIRIFYLSVGLSGRTDPTAPATEPRRRRRPSGHGPRRQPVPTPVPPATLPATGAAAAPAAGIQEVEEDDNILAAMSWVAVVLSIGALALSYLAYNA